jgi:TPR repeat protein
LCYKNGIGVERDSKEAVRYFLFAADQANAEGQYHLGLCYLSGVGVAADTKEAIRYLVLSAEHGNRNAIFILKGKLELVFL